MIQSIPTLLRPFLCQLLIGIGLLCVMPNQLWGTHFQGAEIAYECLGGCTYRIMLTDYFECNGGTPAPPSSGLDFTSLSSCTFTPPTALGNWTTISDIEITPVAPGNPTTCTSQGPGVIWPGVRQVVFSRDYDFCGISCPIEISMGSCCRNVSVSNVSSTGYLSKIEVLDLAICNSSPQWLDPSYMVIEQGNGARFSMAAYDPDGDSLVYSLEPVFTSNGNVPVTYLPGFSATQPFGPSVIPFIDPNHGDLVIPAASIPFGVYTVGVGLTEYRDGIMIGKIWRDMNISSVISFPSLNPHPYIDPNGGGAPLLTGGIYVDSFTVKAIQGIPLSLPIQALDPNAGDTVSMSWSGNLPGANFLDYSSGTITNTVAGISPTAQLDWTPLALGRYAFNIKLEDTTQVATGYADYSFLIIVDSCDLVVDISMDSSLVCPGDTATLMTTVSGGTSPYSYQWNTGETTPDIIVSAIGTYHVTVTDAIGCVVSDSIVHSFLCVWPGDADDNGVVDNTDLLEIGLTYGHSGPLRPSASLNWQAQLATAFPSGAGTVNAAFSDTDGNGLINDDDTLAINLNYGLTHNKFEGTQGGMTDPPLFLVPSSDSVSVGDTLLISVMLGVDTLMADSIYGLAFSIDYDPNLVDSASANIRYNGWLGTYGTDLLGLQRDVYPDGQTHVALTRKDHLPRSGYGEIAMMSIVMIDDIMGKHDVFETLKLDLSGIKLIRADGTEVAVQTHGVEVVVEESSSTSIVDELGTSLKIYPQPAQNQVYLEIGTSQSWKASLYTFSGQLLSHKHLRNQPKTSFPLEGLPGGIYLLRIETETGIVVRKLTISP
ncbi:MAG: T9SS type A sorting domain-containing protein [Bacteroidota bacterium]